MVGLGHPLHPQIAEDFVTFGTLAASLQVWHAFQAERPSLVDCCLQQLLEVLVGLIVNGGGCPPCGLKKNTPGLKENASELKIKIVLFLVLFLLNDIWRVFVSFANFGKTL